MAHWYDSSGKLIERVNGRKTTIREARKLGLLPSVTAIIDQLDKPGLNVWKLNQLFQAMIPFIEAQEGFDPEEVRQEIFADAASEQRTAAQMGSYIHSQFEKYIKGKPVKEDKLCEDILVYVQKHFGTIKEGEVPFAFCRTYGGCIDLVGESHDGMPFILDLKTTNFKLTRTAKQLVKKEHGLQLAAYSVGLRDSLEVVQGNVFVDTSEFGFGRLRHYTWAPEEIERSWAMFKHLLCLWYLDKRLDVPDWLGGQYEN